MLESTLLATVAAVVREGSFERAARQLHITPSAVSQRIRQMEERVGAVLVVRGQPCTATEAGARICRHADSVAMLEHDLRRDLPALAPADAPLARSTIRVAINADTLSTWFVHAMREFCAQSSVLLDVAVDDQDQTSEWLRRGQVLAAVTSHAKAVQGCKVRKLGTLRYCATASPAFVQTHFAGGVTADALTRAPSIVFDRNDRLQERWVRRQVRRDVSLPAHRLPSSQAFVDAALADVGWGMNPLLSVQEHLSKRRLVELVPGRTLDVPLYWQVALQPLPELERLTQCVVRAAGQALL
ncbi:LysR family transcriptional regulator ArgP [Rhodoferax sp.]|uniref:LysR family transcriptional regulator ArgP n=1 Tax=Rhodoferax sp. TaxID=50421 RepID=UPI0025D1BF15|nr:LysR family transcriptional regulator ArgP [Rhodoferax sp.]